MTISPYTKAAIGAVCLGVAVAMFASAVKDLRPCVGCEETAEETATEVAQASAELTGTDD
jgi:hypothetical protein